MKLFEIPATTESTSASRGGRVFRKNSDMVPAKPFDYSKVQKWAPAADFNDLASFYPVEGEKHGVIPQERLLELYAQQAVSPLGEGRP